MRTLNLFNFYVSSGRLSTLVVLCLGLLWSSCNKEEIRPDSLFKVVEVGDFELLQESLDRLPYQGKDSVTFVDRDENKLTLQIRESFNPGVHVYIEDFDVDFPGDTVVYQYGSQSKSINLINDSLDLRFKLGLDAVALDYDTGNPKVVDRLWGWVYFDGEPLGKHILTHYTNLRDYAANLNHGVTEDFEFLGREFQDVYYNRFANPASFVRFSYEFGIISFTDLDNKVWVYEE